MSDPIRALPMPAALQSAGLFAVLPRVEPPADAPLPPAREVAPADGDLERAVQRLHQQAVDVGADLEFSIDEELDRVVVTLRDRRDGSVLRQIPSEEVLRIARMLDELPGPLFQTTV